MKRFVLGICIFLFMFLFTGCGGRSLKCVKVSDFGNYKEEETYYLRFNKKSVKLLDININVEDIKEFDDDSDDSTNFVLQSINDYFSSYYNNKGISYSISNKENGFEYNIKINFNKLSRDMKSKVDIINYTNSYEIVRDELEQKDFICK